MQTFVTQIGEDGVSICGCPWSDAHATVTVSWNAEIEWREWGIAGIHIEITRVHADIAFENWGETDDEITQGATEIDWPPQRKDDSDDAKDYVMNNLDTWKVRFTIGQSEDAGSRGNIPSISPESVEIDYKKRTIEIEF